METKTLVQILDKHIDQEALAADLAKEILLPKLREYVAKTENKIDDAALAIVEKFLQGE